MSWHEVIAYFPQLLQGMLITLELVACALLLGFAMAVGICISDFFNLKALQLMVNAYIFIIRGTPLLVQIFIIYYGIAQFDWLRASFLWFAFKSAFFCAILALAINTSAYTAELLRGVIAALPKGEIEAAYALGLSKWQVLRHLILPRAFRLVLPAYSNEVVILLKASSLASTITLLDLMGVTRLIIADTYATMTFFVIAGILYLLINLILTFLFRQVERRVNVY